MKACVGSEILTTGNQGKVIHISTAKPAAKESAQAVEMWMTPCSLPPADQVNGISVKRCGGQKPDKQKAARDGGFA